MKEQQSSISNTINGAIIAGATLLGNQLLVSLPTLTVAGIMGASITSGILLDKLFAENEYQKLFRLCGLINKAEQIPPVIKKTVTGNKTTLVIHLPAGISQKHFEQKQQELEQHLNAKIEFGFNKNLIIDLIRMELKTKYTYVFEQCEKPLEIYCGETYEGKFYLDIEKCPHIIVSGETDSGKSSLLDIISLSLILSKHNIDLHLIDFQAVTLGKYENCKKVCSYGETPEDFAQLLDEMEAENQKRLALFRSVKNKVYIDKVSVWNEMFPERALSRKVIIIDEYARLAEKDYEDLLERFRTRVSMDRKVGIHYIASLQRPDVKCISGSIKANMPTRIAFKTVTDTDSEVILDQPGAEKLKNQGRFLIKYCGKLTEVQGLYADTKQIRKILKHYNAYKSSEELEKEKIQQEEKTADDREQRIKEWREKNKNPYAR